MRLSTCLTFLAAVGAGALLANCGQPNVSELDEPVGCTADTECVEGATCIDGTCLDNETPLDDDDAGNTSPPDAGTVTRDAGSALVDAGTTLPPQPGTIGTAEMCETCSDATDCAGQGARCNVDSVLGDRRCATPCRADTDCATGARCWALNGTAQHVCYPVARSCRSWPGVDAGTGPLVLDAGTTPFDAGSPRVDAGTPTVDAGTPPIDAGTPPVDAGTPACTDDTWNSYAKGFFSSNCTRCHSWAASYSGVQRKLSRVKSEISSGSMPPRSRLAADQKTRILKWLDCGMPQ